MEPGHVTDDVSAPAVDDDDVNNPFYEPPVRTPSTSSSAASDLRAKLHPGTVRLSDKKDQILKTKTRVTKPRPRRLLTRPRPK